MLRFCTLINSVFSICFNLCSWLNGLYQAAQQLLDQAVATAKQNINAADTNQEVAQAKDQVAFLHFDQ
jgi:hypothetical protein